MIDCKEAAYIIDSSPYKKTKFFKRIGLKFHLVMCPNCAKYQKDSQAVDHILRYVNQHAAVLTPDEKKLMIQKLQDQLAN
jgi:predicted anti-sigma-YlaC factor YlaD